MYIRILNLNNSITNVYSANSTSMYLRRALQTAKQHPASCGCAFNWFNFKSNQSISVVWPSWTYSSGFTPQVVGFYTLIHTSSGRFGFNSVKSKSPFVSVSCWKISDFFRSRRVLNSRSYKVVFYVHTFFIHSLEWIRISTCWWNLVINTRRRMLWITSKHLRAQYTYNPQSNKAHVIRVTQSSELAWV